MSVIMVDLTSFLMGAGAAIASYAIVAAIYITHLKRKNREH